MKRRKRMGLPKAPAICSRRRDDSTTSSPFDDAAEMLRDIMEEQQLAAKQRRLLEPSANSSHGESTPEKFAAFLDRKAERDAALAADQRETARKVAS